MIFVIGGGGLLLEDARGGCVEADESSSVSNGTGAELIVLDFTANPSAAIFVYS